MRGSPHRPDPVPAAESDAARDLREERDRFVGFAFAAADLLLEISGEGQILFAAGAAKALTGVTPAALAGRSFRTLFERGDHAAADALVARARTLGRAEPCTMNFARSGEAPVKVSVSGCLLPGRDTIYLAASAPRPEVSAAGLLAKRDAETGLLDASAFGDAAKQSLDRARDESIGLTLLQLRGIEELRARAGDGTMSELLSEIGGFLRSHALQGTEAGRLAPDRFGVLRSQAAGDGKLGSEIERLARARDPQKQGLAVSERALPLKQSALTPDEAARALAFTLGRFAAVPAEEFSITSLVDGFRAHIADTVAGISRLKGAALERSLEVVFQPIVRLETRAPHHFEMLARFESGKSPFEMIRFAEGIGLIEEIDLRICQRAVAVLETLGNHAVDIAVNVSGRSLASDVFVQSLLALLQPYGVLRERILFEVTESTGMADLVRADRVLTALRRAGHRICLDDFGAGASCFPYLQALTVDFVKIDGAYIGRIGEAQRDRAILKSMIALCRELEIGTIAEKIEREEQARELLALGVRFGQGYLFGQPTRSPSMPVRAKD